MRTLSRDGDTLLNCFMKERRETERDTRTGTDTDSIHALSGRNGSDSDTRDMLVETSGCLQQLPICHGEEVPRARREEGTGSVCVVWRLGENRDGGGIPVPGDDKTRRTVSVLQKCCSLSFYLKLELVMLSYSVRPCGRAGRSLAFLLEHLRTTCCRGELVSWGLKWREVHPQQGNADPPALIKTLSKTCDRSCASVNGFWVVDEEVTKGRSDSDLRRTTPGTSPHLDKLPFIILPGLWFLTRFLKHTACPPQSERSIRSSAGCRTKCLFQRSTRLPICKPGNFEVIFCVRIHFDCEATVHLRNASAQKCQASLVVPVQRQALTVVTRFCAGPRWRQVNGTKAQQVTWSVWWD
ncbi:hypothetical protein AV530_005181 [Patagioenas fasciata monilis]|uniref:Uncharacterized protein n=1 Tax=Patagioenas fasciata monilis TaxID=372326 RepID=A0A1V4K4L8_PATFA|nr:hypothetical protein AV530_005181 [Patagioenas fasciata monilis]